LKKKRWDAVLSRFPPGPITGVELGVHHGNMSTELLKRRQDLFLWMVDINDLTLPLAERNTEFAADRRKVVCRPTHKVRFRGEFDFVFIDADHSYEAVKRDITLWRPKVKPGGWLCGHDLDKPHWGVRRAVEELLPGFEADCDDTWFFRCG
jgi:predicted O-methyltransferase YrrM